MAQQDDGKFAKSLAIFLFLGIALAFTAYQTARGYESAIGTIPAAFLAILCAGTLGLLSVSLRSAVRNSKNTTGLWIGCLIVAGVSFAGNFNSFYTGFIKDELVKTELEAKRISLDEIYRTADVILTDKNFAAFERDIQSMKGQLRAQILNEGNPGLGPKAKEVISRISAALKDPLTVLAAANSSTTALTDLANRYDKQVDEKLSQIRLSRVENGEQRQSAKVANKALYDGAISKVDSSLTEIASKKTSQTQANAISAIEHAVQAYARIGATTKASLPPSIANGFSYNQKLTLVSDKAGSIDNPLTQHVIT
jgi:hypothetical protein